MVRRRAAAANINLESGALWPELDSEIALFRYTEQLLSPSNEQQSVLSEAKRSRRTLNRWLVRLGSSDPASHSL